VRKKEHVKAERFNKTKSAVASGAIALIVAALTFGVSSAVLRPASAPLAATPGSAFTVSSAVFASPACSGPTVLLYPGVIDCAVLTITNNLSVPMTVQSLTATIPSPPAGCPASNFSLPTFNGNLTVPANGTARTGGQPISLIETGTNQDACQGVTVSFSFSGSSQYTDATTTALAVSPSTPTTGQPETLTATVNGANAANDPSAPTGAVTFNDCPTAACTSSTSLGSGNIGSGGVATINTTSLSNGAHYVQAVYGGQGTDYTGSASPVVTLTVGAPAAAGSSIGGGNGASTGASTNSSKGGNVAFTGADIAGMVVAGVALIGVGTLLVLAVRRRKREVLES
jgi:hypothetical protein